MIAVKSMRLTLATPDPVGVQLDIVGENGVEQDRELAVPAEAGGGRRGVCWQYRWSVVMSRDSGRRR